MLRPSDVRSSYAPAAICAEHGRIMQLTLAGICAKLCFFCERSRVVLCTCCFQCLETHSNVFFLIRISDAYDTHQQEDLFTLLWTNLQHPTSDVCDENRRELNFLGNVMALDAPSIPLLWLIRLLAHADTAAVYPIWTVLVLRSSCVACPG
jgi:hypothetical protein